ncbi:MULTISPECIES: DsrE family protein [unclassified Saccharicrinis]|uniref:DsrE family protein n=1 Tax=unclassified Saccharicrinis TaxID=2646859 RepID=UPI003D33491A
MRILLIMAVMLLCNPKLTNAQEKEPAEKEKLMVIWSSGDPEVAEKVCLMYTHAAKKYGWFQQVNLIVWGPSAKLLSENEDLQAKVKQMKQDGVIVEACIHCAKMYNVADELKEFGIDVKGMGKPLTKRLKEGWCQLNY